MNSRTGWLALAATGAVVLAGCAASPAATDARIAAAAAPGAAMTAGMVMPDGSTMGAGQPSSTPTPSGPSAAAQMICSAKTRASIGQALGLPAAPQATAAWRDHTYTCSYQLPAGPLVLSVNESADAATARGQLDEVRQALGSVDALAGLTTTAFGTSDGTVVLLKDSDVLRVDATGLPAVFGSQQQKRTDFAYEVASDVLGCWTGD